MVGGAGSKNMMNLIKADSSPIKATVLYSPSMASTAAASRPQSTAMSGRSGRSKKRCAVRQAWEWAAPMKA